MKTRLKIGRKRLFALMNPFVRTESPFKLLTLIFCAALGGCKCNSFFFFPQSQILLTPDRLGVTYETVAITSEDSVVLSSWLLKPSDQVRGRILFLHGNAENISTHIHNIVWLAQNGYELLLLDYRGYGLSEGKPCLPEVVQDVEAAYEWLREYNRGEAPLFMLGQSLGASLAAYSVGKHPQWPLAGVILDAPFASYRDIAREKLGQIWLTWPFRHPLSWLFSDTYSPSHTVEKISPRPLLMFYSKQDRVVPGHHSQALFDRALPPKQLIVTEERHTASFGRDEYRRELLSFLDAYAQVE